MPVICEDLELDQKIKQPCPSQRQKQLVHEQTLQGGRGRRGRQSTGTGSLLMEVWGCSLAAERWRGATTLRAGGATNGPSSGCVSVTVAGLEQGSRGFSGRQARVGRGSGSKGVDCRNGLGAGFMMKSPTAGTANKRLSHSNTASQQLHALQTQN